MGLEIWLGGIAVSLSLYIIKLIREEVNGLRVQLMHLQNSTDELSDIVNSHDKQLAILEIEIESIKTGRPGFFRS